MFSLSPTISPPICSWTHLMSHFLLLLRSSITFIYQVWLFTLSPHHRFPISKIDQDNYFLFLETPPPSAFQYATFTWFSAYLICCSFSVNFTGSSFPWPRPCNVISYDSVLDFFSFVSTLTFLVVLSNTMVLNAISVLIHPKLISSSLNSLLNYRLIDLPPYSTSLLGCIT